MLLGVGGEDKSFPVQIAEELSELAFASTVELLIDISLSDLIAA